MPWATFWLYFPDLFLEMVKVLNFSYVFKYPFELVTQAYFKKVGISYFKTFITHWNLKSEVKSVLCSVTASINHYILINSTHLAMTKMLKKFGLWRRRKVFETGCSANLIEAKLYYLDALIYFNLIYIPIYNKSLLTSCCG